MFLKQGVLPPTVELAKPIQPTPAGRVKSGLIRRFGLVPQWVRTLSTHAIASQAQSHRLKPNLTRLDRNSLSLVSEVLRRGVAPFGDWFCQFCLSPNSKGFGCFFRILCFLILLRYFVEFPSRVSSRGESPSNGLVKLPFRRWLWGKTAMACVLSVRTHCSFFPETPYQR